MNVPVCMNVSVIATVFDEAASIHRLLESLACQTRGPDEIVICDGGSRDDTVERIVDFAARYRDRLPNIRVLVERGANISRGRNVAIAAASGPIIAVTDAGVRLSPIWLEHLVAAWDAGENPHAVAGFFLPDVDSAFTAAMGATVLPLEDEIDPRKFLPSSRSVAFTKDAWAQAGGYPEWLDYCEDLIFDFRVNALTPERPSAFEWRPQAVVYFRPRDSLRSFWTQYYRYARGDGKADLWRKRHALRYVVYLAIFPALLGHALWGGWARGLGWIGLLAGALLYCRRPWQRLATVGRNLSGREKAAAALLVPVIRVVGDCAKMAGYPVGLWWRFRRRGQAEIDWRAEARMGHEPADRRT